MRPRFQLHARVSANFDAVNGGVMSGQGVVGGAIDRRTLQPAIVFQATFGPSKLCCDGRVVRKSEASHPNRFYRREAHGIPTSAAPGVRLTGPNFAFVLLPM